MAKDHRNIFHLEPRMGWMNDPNGLVFHNGTYHVYFQYTAEDPSGNGKRTWGHFESRDLMRNFDFKGIVLSPDIPEDKDGVFSGSTIRKDGRMHIFYTGNSDFQYQIHVESDDGREMSHKTVVLRPEDYPEDIEPKEVRDPFIYEEVGLYKMVLGAQRKDRKGTALIYSSGDLKAWSFERSLFLPDCGYMWECPELFELSGQGFLSVCLQGMEHGEYSHQNVYSSGYFKTCGEELLPGYTEFDHGFDFYAPKTFIDHKGDRILLAWMGIGDIPYTNPTEGYRHCLTIPRRLDLSSDGNILQIPLVRPASKAYPGDALPLMLKLDSHNIEKKFNIYIDDAKISFCDGIVSLSFGKSGFGRDIRKVKAGSVEDMMVLVDRSCLEIFINGGRYVMSSRFYPDSITPEISFNGCEPKVLLFSVDNCH